MQIVSFDDAKAAIAGSNKKHLLLGNGFSIALRPDIFTYGSLFDNADFSAAPRLIDLFDALGTKDFETVIQYLLNAAKVVEVYRPKLVRLSGRLREDADLVKSALVNAVARHHPDRPYDIDVDQYQSCRKFLKNYNHIFSLNYDVLLYWSLMQDEIDALNLHADDGFRHPEDDPDLPYVSWQQSHSSTIHYLHGALHLFDQDTDIIKYTWSKTDIPIVDQIREALDEEKYPLFVSEGSSASKWRRIMHSAYLHKAYRSLESCCKPSTGAMVIYGHSLAENDAHILRCIGQGGIGQLAIGVYGDAASDENMKLVQRATKLVDYRLKKRGERYPLELILYDAGTAKIWG